MVHFAYVPTEAPTRADDVDRAANDKAVQDVTPPLSTHGLSAGLAAQAELEQLGDNIAELAAHVHAATYRLLVMLAEFDRRGGWGGGFRSCAHWLSWRTRIDLGAAREKVRVARALEHLPQLSDALRRGELSYAIVRAVTRIATPQNESELLELARHGTASHVERVVRAWRRVDRLEEQWAERERRRSRCLQLYPDDDGMFVLRGRLSPEVGALLERALEAAREALYARPKDGGSPVIETTYTQRQADAIGLLAEWALGADSRTGAAERAVSGSGKQHGGAQSRDAAADRRQCRRSDGADRCGTRGASRRTRRTAREGSVTHRGGNAPTGAVKRKHDLRKPSTTRRAERFQVVVHVDAEALRVSAAAGQAVLAGGIRISAETCRRIACDASRVQPDALFVLQAWRATLRQLRTGTRHTRHTRVVSGRQGDTDFRG